MSESETDFPAEEEEDASEDDFPAEEMDGAGDALPEELAERFRQIREEQERQLDQEAAAARERKLETQRRRQLNERLEESKRRRVHCQLAKVNVRAASARPHTAASQGPLRPGGRRPSCSPDAGVPYSRDDHLMGWDFDGMMEAVGACDGALRGRGSKQLREGCIKNLLRLVAKSGNLVYLPFTPTTLRSIAACAVALARDQALPAMQGEIRSRVSLAAAVAARGTAVRS